MIAVAILVSLVLGAAVAASIAVTTGSVRKSAHAGEVKMLTNLLEVERGRTADLLTRLAARSVGEYHAVTTPVGTAPPRQYLTDDTGLVTVEVEPD